LLSTIQSVQSSLRFWSIVVVIIILKTCWYYHYYLLNLVYRINFLTLEWIHYDN
jgi:hypothetical protein